MLRFRHNFGIIVMIFGIHVFFVMGKGYLCGAIPSGFVKQTSQGLEGWGEEM